MIVQFACNLHSKPQLDVNSVWMLKFNASCRQAYKWQWKDKLTGRQQVSHRITVCVNNITFNTLGCTLSQLPNLVINENDNLITTHTVDGFKICDQVCENQPCQRTKIATLFQLCCVITHVLVLITG